MASIRLSFNQEASLLLVLDVADSGDAGRLKIEECTNKTLKRMFLTIAYYLRLRRFGNLANNQGDLNCCSWADLKYALSQLSSPWSWTIEHEPRPGTDEIAKKFVL